MHDKKFSKNSKECFRIIHRGWGSISFLFLGLGSLIWFLIRVIPKPGRAAYPCMKAAAPVASTFILYITGLLASVTAFKKARVFYRHEKYRISLVLLVLCVSAAIFSFSLFKSDSYATQHIIYEFNDPLGPNRPVGEAKGIFPGRVVWMHHPDATNENCTNEDLNDAYFLPENTDQDVVDQMFSKGILSLTGKEFCEEAWDAIFKYFNVNHGKGEIGYQSDETIFIKINAVSAWSGIGFRGVMGKLPDESDTTPQTMLAMLRQLVYHAGVTESNIYIGDPMAGIWNHIYDVLSAEFPNVNYMDVDAITAGRTKLVECDSATITYSDHGTVLTDRWDFDGHHHLYESMVNADYLLNIPVMKGHRWAGVTLFSKNHFGSNTSGNSWQLHRGLMKFSDHEEVRTGYSRYRVLVDLMASQYLGGKTLLYFMDALWATSYEHQKPQKFLSEPFNNDWSSSLLFSLDHVAIESVCLDILQKEFTEEDSTAVPPRFTYVQWDGVDDYLHQAASSEWWPDSLVYDPDSSGTPIASLGVHEHWNNTEDMMYSRNLGTGEGIELVKIFEESSSDINEPSREIISECTLHDNYPNPFNPSTTISFYLPENSFASLKIFDVNGRLVDVLVQNELHSGEHTFQWHGGQHASGTYIYRFSTEEFSISKKMTLEK